MTKKNNNKKDNQNLEHDVTGHSWDGISEYNIGAPRWWLIVWIICIIWAVIFWFFYPTWPTPEGNNKGSLGWSQVSQLNESQKEIDARQKPYLDRFEKATLEEIKQDKQLLEFALNGGKIAFLENCAACHGKGAAGQKGYPNLNDDDWLWGGSLSEIYQTLNYGIRSGHENTRENAMPAFGVDEILTENQINDVIDHVLSLSRSSKNNENGAKIFQAQCASCHQDDGKGNKELGAPNLTDKIWLYGKDRKDLYHSIYYSRAGVMPYWSGRLNDHTIKALAIYVHSLGGGQ